MYLVCSNQDNQYRIFIYFLTDACPALSISGGSVSYSSMPNAVENYASGTMASFTCDIGRVLVGASSIRTCMDTPGSDSVGTWSDSSPSCAGKIQNLVFISYIIMIVSLTLNRKSNATL